MPTNGISNIFSPRLLSRDEKALHAAHRPVVSAKNACTFATPQPPSSDSAPRSVPPPTMARPIAGQNRRCSPIPTRLQHADQRYPPQLHPRPLQLHGGPPVGSLHRNQLNTSRPAPTSRTAACPLSAAYSPGSSPGNGGSTPPASAVPVHQRGRPRRALCHHRYPSTEHGSNQPVPRRRCVFTPCRRLASTRLRRHHGFWQYIQSDSTGTSAGTGGSPGPA